MVTFKAYSDIGSREINEDCVGQLEMDGSFCFVLADGLGGHGRGEVASATATETVLQLYKEEGLHEGLLDACFRKAQADVIEKQQTSTEYYGMKTTLVVLTLSDKQAQWGHIGDSRLYCFQGGKLKSRTRDHSVPQMLVETGEINESDIRFHEDRNRLLRVIGAEWGRRSYELSESMTLKKEYAFLLCSDGFWELIDEEQMQAELKKASSVDEWLDAMVTIVEQQGADRDMDNNSAIAVWVTKG